MRDGNEQAYHQAEFITRAEYEARNSIQEQRLMRIEADFVRQLTEVSTKMDIIAEAVQKAKISAWQFIAVTLANFLIAGGMFAVLQALLHPK